MTDNNNKSDHTRFVEVQYFWQQPLAWIVWIIAVLLLYWLKSADLIEQTFAFIAILFVLGILLIVFFTRLTTEIGVEGISYRMWPFHKKSRLIEWSDIEHAEVRQYKPIREYGGWGMRFGMHGRAYNIKGNMGLQIKLTSGQSILLGTQRPDEIEEILDSMYTRVTTHAYMELLLFCNLLLIV